MSKFAAYYQRYGICGVIAPLCILLKTVVFYSLVDSYTPYLMALVTCLFALSLFCAIECKWAAFALHAVFAVLMFSDLTYSSYFNRYLSVKVASEAAFLGDLTESIAAVMKPVNFLMFLDLVFIAIALVHTKKQGSGEGKKRTLRFAPLVLASILTVCALWNPGENKTLTSISNSELVIYHIKDLLTGGGKVKLDPDMPAFVDNYTSQLGGEFFGMAEGKNLVMIQVESFQDFVIGLTYNGQEVTPNLNALLRDHSVYFDNFYLQTGSGNTSDAEFAANNSIMGSQTSYTYSLYPENLYNGLPMLLRERGYTTSVYHAYEDKMFWNREVMYPHEGFDQFYGGLTTHEGNPGIYTMTEWLGWGLSDSEFYPQAMEYMKQIQEPYYNFVITLSNHHPFKMPEQYDFLKLLPEDEDTFVGNYLQSACYTDYSLGVFFDLLKENNMYDNTVFVIYGDHVGLTHSDEVDASMEKILGKPYDFEEFMKVPLIIHVPGAPDNFTGTNLHSGGQIDILPTLGYLFGFEDLDTIYLGNNLFNAESVVAEQMYMSPGSYFHDEVAFEMSRDGVFENSRAWNIYTLEPVPLEECYDDYVTAQNIINTSEYILSSDAIRSMKEAQN